MRASFPDIDSIVIAAGSSSRMGAFKPLLSFGESSIIGTIIRKLEVLGLGSILVVGGYNHQLLQAELKGYPATLVVNEEYERGMLSSIQVGIRSLSEKGRGVLIHLVDQPFIKLETLKMLLSAFAESKAGIVVPSYRGKHGHPVIISRRYFGEIFELDDAIGLRQLMKRHRDDIYEVSVPTDDVLRDIDTWQDYERELAIAREK